jgi:hypothetical protein
MHSGVRVAVGIGAYMQAPVIYVLFDVLFSAFGLKQKKTGLISLFACPECCDTPVWMSKWARAKP